MRVLSFLVGEFSGSNKKGLKDGWKLGGHYLEIFLTRGEGWV